MKPADLKTGDRFETAIGVLVVRDEPFDVDDDDMPEFGRIMIDVEVPDPGRFGDAARLLDVTGASEFQWLGLIPLRYRLAFRPDADVTVER